MTTKTLEKPLVEFFATSPRLAHAFRHAVRRNKKLARHASIHELGQAGMSFDAARHVSEYQAIILSHADDDHFVLTDQRLQQMVSGAFHLLFTEPNTHPDQVPQWMRATKIRSESRLHVVRVENLEDPQLSELLGRVCSAFRSEDNCGSIIDAYLAADTLHVRGPKHRMLHIPFSSIPAWRGQPRVVLQNFKIDPDGSFLYWPDIDVHLGWNQFLQTVDPAELRKAQQRSADFNRRYGAAIREVRESAGISQSKIEGLTDRQVRRIEQGLCKATSGALAAFAKTLGLEVNVYLAKLAKGMS